MRSPRTRHRIGRLVGPAIDIDDCAWIGGPSATTDASRVAITYLASSDSMTVVLDGRSGTRLGSPIVGPPDQCDRSRRHARRRRRDQRGHPVRPRHPRTDRRVSPSCARGAIDQLTFSADGSLLLVESRNQILSIYDAASRTRLGDPITTNALFDETKGALRPDGNIVAINHGDGFTTWELNPNHLATAACKLAGRNLTKAEWDTYIGNGEPHRRTCPEHS